MASSNVRRAVGKASESARPMPTCCAPWPGKSRAISGGPRRRGKSYARPQSRLLRTGVTGGQSPHNRAMIEVAGPFVQPTAVAGVPGHRRGPTWHDGRRAAPDPAPRPLRRPRAGAGAAVARRPPRLLAGGPGRGPERLGARPRRRRGASGDRRPRPRRALVPVVARLAPDPVLEGPGRRREPPPHGGRGRRRPRPRPHALRRRAGGPDRRPSGHACARCWSP